MNCYLSKVKEQNKIDNAEVIRKKNGRPSTYKHMKSSDIKIWMHDIIQNKIFNLIRNKSDKIRIDIFTTEYFRIIKKVPHYFIKNFWTQIYFNSPDLTKYAIGITEAFSAYSFSQNNFDASNIVENVIDFSVVYFSEEKWAKLIDELMKISNDRMRSHLNEKLIILKLRNISTAKNMKKLVNISKTIKELFEGAFQVLIQFHNVNSNGKAKSINYQDSNNSILFDSKFKTKRQK